MFEQRIAGSRVRARAGRSGAPGRARVALGETAAALTQALCHPGLRRMQASWALMNAAGWAYIVAIAIFAYHAGGAAAVGLAVVIRSLPAVAGIPVTALVADRLSRHRALVASGAVNAVTLAACGTLVAVDAAPGVLYALGAVVAMATMVFRQAQSALLPALAANPGQLAAANATATTIEGAGILAGPALTGAIVAFGSVTAVFYVTAAGALLATLAAAAIHAPAEADRPRAAEARSVAGALAGLRDAALEPPVRLILGLLLSQTIVSGALNVFVVVCAVELLGLGSAGVGALTAAYGVGGLLGGLAALAYAGRANLVSWLSIGLVLWGAPLLALGVAPEPALAPVLMAAIGLGNTLFDVASVTLLQRAVRDDLLARVFGALETVVVIGLGLGALLAGPAIAALGIRGALILGGALLPLLVLVTARGVSGTLAEISGGARMRGRPRAPLSSHVRRLPVALLAGSLLALAFAAAAQGATTNRTVSPANLQGWNLTASDGNVSDPPPSAGFVGGPGSPPAGTGSVRLAVGADGDGDDAAQARHNGYAGALVSSLAELAYATWVEDRGQGSDGRAPYILLNVDFDGNGSSDDLWLFEPVYQEQAFASATGLPAQAAVALETWQTWDADAGGWWSLTGLAGSGPGTSVKPLSALLTVEPDARIANVAAGGVRIVAGFWSGLLDDFAASADRVVVGFGADTTVYDFEQDADADGVVDVLDNCPAAGNDDQANLDGDTQGDACDADDDGDSVADASDNCIRTVNGEQADVDADGTGDACDATDDRPKPRAPEPAADRGVDAVPDGGDAVPDAGGSCTGGGVGGACVPFDPAPGPCQRSQLPGGTTTATLIGGMAGDHIVGGHGGDLILGLAGDDCLEGLGGPDRIEGGDGSDRLRGGAGSDRLRGGSGSDRLRGGSGRNSYFGRSGDDRIHSANGIREAVSCGRGRDRAIVDRHDATRGCEHVTRRG